MIFIEKEFNAATGIETITEREASAEEIAEVEAAQAEYAQRELEAEAKAAQKAALLDRLGITEAEAKLLLA
jgi:hypothetical protein